MAIGRKKTRDINMTEGSIARHLISFAVPLLLGNLFQQLYNTVDSWVVGNYVSAEAFSAVSTISPIVNLFISFFSGMGNGAGVVISQYYGNGDDRNANRTVHAAMSLIIVMGVVVTIAGIFLSPALLTFMKTPPEIFVEADIYLKIYCSGLMFLVIYNLGSSILRAVGDSTRPFYFLVACALVNIVLDLLFVLKFGMGVEGVAYATIISEAVSMILVVVTMLRESNCVKLRPKELLHIDRNILARIVKIGLPSGLQMGITSFSNVFIHSYINRFGTDVIGGYAAYLKCDRFVLLPIQSFNMAITTFVGQNLGNGDIPRARKGIRTAFLISFIAVAGIEAVLYPAAPFIVKFFSPQEEVIRYGSMFIRIMCPFFFVQLVHNILVGSLRGAGDTQSTMIVTLSSYVVFRQIYMYVVYNYISQELVPVFMGIPAAWIMASVLTTINYAINSGRRFRNVVNLHAAIRKENE